MPRTHLAFLVGTLALVGIPPFAGFWSKDAILASALQLGGTLGWVLFVAGLLGALLTGAYSFRLYYTVFHGGEHEVAEDHPESAHGHARGEGPPSMLVPVGVLAVLSTIGGLLSIPGVWTPFGDWLADLEPLVEATSAQDYLTSAIAVALGVVGFLVARRAFQAGRQLVTSPAAWNLLEHKFYVDDLYDALFYRPAVALARALRIWVEEPIVEGSLDEIGTGTIEASGSLARLQSGLLRTYALVIALSVGALVIVFVAVK
jgi:NADH-quinone oxidoreductase subunit L